MKITIESTTRVVEIQTGIKCRVWEGTTESGIRVQCLIPRISAHTHEDSQLSEFERDLTAQKSPSDAALICFPLRMVL